MEASQPKPRRLTGYQLAAACIDLAASLEQPNFKAAFRGRGFAIVFTSELRRDRAIIRADLTIDCIAPGEMSVAFLWYRAFEHAVEEVGVAAQRFATARNDEWWWTSQDEDACVGQYLHKRARVKKLTQGPSRFVRHSSRSIAIQEGSRRSRDKISSASPSCS